MSSSMLTHSFHELELEHIFFRMHLREIRKHVSVLRTCCRGVDVSVSRATAAESLQSRRMCGTNRPVG